MPATNPIHLSPLPESLIMGIKKSCAGIHLHGAMLDLDQLRVLIRNGQENLLAREWLHREEQEKLQTLHYEKRHREWLGGRICVKQAAIQYRQGNNLLAPHLLILSAASGRPFLAHKALPEDRSMPSISISHSRRYALAVAASTSCGIDIQISSDALGRVRDRFCSHEEEGLLGRDLGRLPGLDRLTLLWAAKEAVKKGAELARMPGFLDLILTHIEDIPEAKGLAAFLFTLDYSGSHQNADNPQQRFQVTVCLHQGYGIGLCVLPAQPCPGDNHA